MAENKTQPTAADVAAFLDTVPDPGRRTDTQILSALMTRVSGEPAAMWGPAIIGFGCYHYRYDSGREGRMARISFSPRKAETVLYLNGDAPGYAALLERLGPHRTGKACLYIKRLDAVDMTVLEEMIGAAWAEMARRYPIDQMPAYQS